MTFQVLVSTMHQNDYSLLEKMNINSSAVVINQCTTSSCKHFLYKGFDIVWVNSVERGISNSRNLALKYSTADICLLADDDEVFYDNCEKVILHHFEVTNADIGAFCIEGIEKKFKNYSNKGGRIGLLKSFKLSSVELAMKRQKIIDGNISFNSLLGTGAKYYCGEENVFLSECLANKLQVYYTPQYIAKLHIGNSSWFKGYNRQYFVSIGASFCAMRRIPTMMMILQFSIRKHKLYKKEMPFVQSIKYMNEGKRNFLKDMKNENF